MPSALEELARRGSAIYEERRAEFEKNYPGKFLAINPATAEVFPGNSPEEAVAAARRAHPDALVHLVRVGGPGVYRVGFSRAPRHGVLL